jgi:hypothetical protein
MINIDGSEIRIEGVAEDLIAEITHGVHSVIQAILKNIGEDKVSYEEILTMVMVGLANMNKINAEENVWGYEEELSFLKQVRDLRKKHQHEEDFMDYDSGNYTPGESLKKKATETKLKNTSTISGGMSIGDFVIDPRAAKENLFDIDDLRKPKKD